MVLGPNVPCQDRMSPLPPPPSPPLSTNAAFLAMVTWAQGLRTRLAAFNKALLRTLMHMQPCCASTDIKLESNQPTCTLVLCPDPFRKNREGVWSGLVHVGQSIVWPCCQTPSQFFQKGSGHETTCTLQLPELP